MKNVLLFTIISLAALSSFAVNENLSRLDKQYVLECSLSFGSSDIYSFNVYRSKIDKKIYKEVELSGTIYKASLASASELKANHFILKFKESPFQTMRTVDLNLTTEGWYLQSKSEGFSYDADLGPSGCKKN